MDGWVDGWVGGWVYFGLLGLWVGGWMDGWMDINVWITFIRLLVTTLVITKCGGVVFILFCF